MCLATPVKVKIINQKIATVFDGEKERKVNVMMIEGLRVGDYILAHADLGIERLSDEQAKEILKLNRQYHKIENRHQKIKDSK